MTPVARRNLHVAQGAQSGADLPLKAGSTCVIGSSPAQCSVVLPDEGVAARHCALTVDARGRVTCTALDATVGVGQRALPPGASMAMPDFLPLRCGHATLLVGPEGSDWSFALAAAESAPGLWRRTSDSLRHRRGSNQIAAGGLLLASTLLVAGSVWGAASWLATPLRSAPLDNFVQVQRWLQSVAPSGSELQVIADETRQRLVVSGYVPTERQRDALAAALARQPDAPQAEMVSVEQMLASVARIAQDQGVRCEAAYRGAGRAACSNPVTDAAAAERLRTAASAQVAGLRELSLPPAPAATAAAKPGRRFAVLMSNRRGSQLIGPTGERWHEGEFFDGMTIRRIEFDQVVFERDSSEVVLALAQLR